MPRLRVKNGANKNTVYEIKSEAMSLGRDDSEVVQILDQGVSRSHSEIFRIGEMYFIRDLGSRNGTYVNEEKIGEELLRNGDEIKIGSTILIFEDAEGGVTKPRRERRSAVDETVTINLDVSGADLEDFETEDAQESKDLRIVYQVAKIISTERDLGTLLDKVVAIAGQAVSADQVYVFLKSPGKKEFNLEASWEREPDDGPQVSRGIIKRVIKFSKAILTSDASMDDRFSDNQSVMIKSIKSVICAPLVGHSQMNGVIYLSSSRTASAFRSEDLELITALAVQTGVAIQAMLAAQTQERMLLSIVRTLVETIEMKTPQRKGHSLRVMVLVAAAATKMGLRRSKKRRLQIAGLLHNIGSVALSNEEGELQGLSGQELDIKQLELAVKLVSNMYGMKFVLPAISSQKERWDGSGFPEGLKGEDIPLDARIIGASDQLDQLLSAAEEGDAEGLSVPQALEKLQETAGLYDPKVIAAFEAAHKDGILFNPPDLVEL